MRALHACDARCGGSAASLPRSYTLPWERHSRCSAVRRGPASRRRSRAAPPKHRRRSAVPLPAPRNVGAEIFLGANRILLCHCELGRVDRIDGVAAGYRRRGRDFAPVHPSRHLPCVACIPEDVPTLRWRGRLYRSDTHSRSRPTARARCKCCLGRSCDPRTAARDFPSSSTTCFTTGAASPTAINTSTAYPVGNTRS